MIRFFLVLGRASTGDLAAGSAMLLRRRIGEHVRSTPGGEGVHVILVLDRAGWHTSPRVEWPSNVTPLFLPPYSPELNPAERLWHWLRSHHLANRVYRDADHLYDATTKAWNTLTPERLQTVCHASYMERGD